MGMAGWYRRFIVNFSQLTAPITDLIRKSTTKFKWTDEADVAFLKLKQILISAPILKSPNFDLPFSIQTDASDRGIGAILTQGDGIEEHVVAYMSMKLTTQQRKYSATERECLAVLEAINKFRPYVEGVRFKVVTDHESLKWLANLKDPTSRLARWALKLQQFDFHLVHRKGKLNVVADALSRAVDAIDSQNTQATDDDYSKLLTGITEHPDRYSEFKTIDGQVYKRVNGKGALDGNQTTWKVYVAPQLRKEVISKYHDSQIGAHLGFTKTLARIRERHFWPKMSNEVLRYVSVCEECQQNKHSNTRSRVKMGKFKDPKEPWEVVAIDYMGPFPRSKAGNQHLLIILDIFSKFVLLKPVRNAEGRSLINIIESEVFLVYGVPKTLISDNGQQFRSKIFVDFLKQYGVTQFLNPSYHPQNNPSERVNRVILSSMRAYLQGDQRNWDRCIPHIACALRSATHGSTQMTPYFINFGRNIEIDGTRLPDQLRNVTPVTDRNKIYEIVRRNLKDAYEKYSSYYNLRTRPLTFSEKEVCLKKNFKLSNAVEHYNAKLDHQYLKVMIKKVLGGNTYEISDLNGKYVGNFHANDLRKLRTE